MKQVDLKPMAIYSEKGDLALKVNAGDAIIDLNDNQFYYTTISQEVEHVFDLDIKKLLDLVSDARDTLSYLEGLGLDHLLGKEDGSYLDNICDSWGKHSGWVSPVSPYETSKAKLEGK